MSHTARQGVTVYYRRWHPTPSHQLWKRCVPVKQMQYWGVHQGISHTNTIVITAEIESGFVTKDDLVPFHCSPVSSCAAPLLTGASMGPTEIDTGSYKEDLPTRIINTLADITSTPDLLNVSNNPAYVDVGCEVT
ncbi:hypothetical protein TNCV_1093891 [Trichonephila clavipes]|uniref:Uncharacterized protein n=1 Tax=Trichonephila clavipes TaxID=2585209 RepID=A0A8X6V524_TRICX|nr:hypothetical protein TNCV_1093891 [Trichonephila clavipes]